MSIKWIVSLFFVLSLGSTLTAFAEKAPYQITAIKAHLYYDDTGEIGKQDIVKLPGGSLFNTVIGEGIAGRPSNTTLILVEIMGPDFANKDIGQLTLKVTSEATQKPASRIQVILEQSVDLNQYFQENKKKILIPFWLYQTGSLPVTVTATLKGGKDDKKMTTVYTQKILFGGGE